MAINQRSEENAHNGEMENQQEKVEVLKIVMLQRKIAKSVAFF